MRQQLPGRKKVMPVGPATLADRLLGFVAAHRNRLRRNESLALPLGEAFTQQFEHFGFAGKVGGIGGGVAAISCLLTV